jgi:tetratricopeptide (TPR) repeat protein
MLGYPDQALERIQRTLSLAQERGHLSTSVMALHHAARGRFLRREPQIAQELAEAGLALSNEHGYGLWTALCTIQLGQALAQSGQQGKGIVHLEEGTKAARAAGTGYDVLHLGAFAEAYGKTGRGAEGLKLIEEALVAVGDSGQRPNEPELHRIKGELLLVLDGTDPREAKGCFRDAIEKAQSHAAKSGELRATISLARLLRDTGRRAEAHTILADIYNWLTEGFDTADFEGSQGLARRIGRVAVCARKSFA